MSEQDIALEVSKFLLSNWGEVIGGLVALIVGSISLTWFISHQLHKKKIEVLELRIAHHETNFDQFSSLMEQRLLIAEKDAERLQRILVEKKSVDKTVIEELEKEPTEEPSEIPMLSIRTEEPEEETSRIANMIDRVASINTLLKVLNTLY